MLFRSILAAGFAIAIVAGSALANTDTALKQLFDVTRLQEQLQDFPEAITAALDPDSGFDGDVPFAAVEALADRHFAATVLEGDLLRLLEGQLSPEQIEANLAFYTSEFGQRMVALEVAAAQADEDEADRVGAETWEAWFADGSPRIDLIDRAIHAGSEVEWFAAVTMNATYAILTALYAGPIEEGGATEAEILEMTNEVGLGIRGKAESILRSHYAYTYRDVSDADFEHYLSFMLMSEALAVNGALLNAFESVIVARSRAFAEAFRVLTRQKRT